MARRRPPRMPQAAPTPLPAVQTPRRPRGPGLPRPGRRWPRPGRVADAGRWTGATGKESLFHPGGPGDGGGRGDFPGQPSFIAYVCDETWRWNFSFTVLQVGGSESDLKPAAWWASVYEAVCECVRGVGGIKTYDLR